MTTATFPRRYLNPLLWLSLCLLASFSPARAADFFVAPLGSDQNPGTLDNPFATWEKARDAVRTRLNENRHQSLTIQFRGGTYFLTEPVVLGLPDSPEGHHRVIYEAYPGEIPVFSGGRAIPGWKVTARGLWEVVLPEVKNGWVPRELFADGNRRPRARHPNEGYLRIAQAGPDRRTRFTFNPGDLKPVPDLAQVELVFLHDWSISRIGVKEIDPASQTLTTTDRIGPNAPHYAMDHYEKHPRYFMENSRAYLDQPGEWHLDEATAKLTYHPMAGEKPGKTGIILPRAETLLVVRGDTATGEPVRNLEFRGLHFQHAAWSLPEHGYAAGQAAYHELREGAGGTLRNVVPPALKFEVAEDCVFSGGRLAHLGGSGISFGQRCHRNLLENTVLTDVSANGIMVGEDRGRRLPEGAWWQVAPDQAATANVVRGCLIERCGKQFFGAVGIWGGFTRETLITHNTIRHLPYTGVSLGWMWNPTPTPCRDNRVEHNHIHHVMQTLSDGAGIYTLGLQPGTVLSHNLIHDVPLNAGRAESNGMFLDEGTTDVVIENNVIYNIDKSPLRFHRATTNLVQNNLLVVGPGVPPIRYNSTKDTDIVKRGNTVAEQVEDPFK